MRILSVDTSSERGSVCVMDGSEVAGEVRLSTSIQHSDRLFGSIQFLFQYITPRLEDIDVFAAARGPGSFTGLRIGLAASEGFVAAFGKQGAGISTLEALAWNVKETEGILLAPTIDARRGEVYGALYRRRGNELVEEHPPVVLKPAEWFNSLPRQSMILCGDGAIRYKELIDAHRDWEIRNVDLYLARSIAEMVLSPRRGPLQPLYVRRTDAEIARERRHESIASPHS